MFHFDTTFAEKIFADRVGFEPTHQVPPMTSGFQDRADALVSVDLSVLRRTVALIHSRFPGPTT
jgi:hypothetical protein